jgi:hypothetical protein
MGTIILFALATLPTQAVTPATLAADLAPPVRLTANGKPIDVERNGHSSPCVGDFYGDGKAALLVGQMDGGKVRIYRNEGTAKEPKYGDFEWFKAGGARVSVSSGYYIGSCPQLADFDGDGKLDVFSGSWNGAITWFRREAGGFAKGETLKHPDGKPVNFDQGSFATAFDWKGDGLPDLIVGTSHGEVAFFPNVGTKGKPAFGKAEPILAGGKKIAISCASPVVADWDGDGLPDLVVGGEDGSVVWFRNQGNRKEPKLTAAKTLVPPSTTGRRSDKSRNPDESGIRARPAVVDWDGDGKLDLLIGDQCGGYDAKPRQNPAEAAEEKEAIEQLAALRKEWAAAYKEFAALSDSPEPAPTALEAYRLEFANAADKVKRLRDEIVRVQEVRDDYLPREMSHGYVWLFRRIDAPK